MKITTRFIASFLFIVFLILLVTFQQKFKLSIEGTVAIALGLATVYLQLNANARENDKLFHQLFTAFNERFAKVKDDLNKSVKEKSFDISEDTLSDYLNLCAEEYLWRKRGRISKNVWEFWKAGIYYYLNGSEKVKNYFARERREKESYYGFFDEVKF